MNLDCYYWYFKSALSHKFCDEIIKFALQQKDQLGVTGPFENKNLGKKDAYKLKEKLIKELESSLEERHVSFLS